MLLGLLLHTRVGTHGVLNDDLPLLPGDGGLGRVAHLALELGESPLEHLDVVGLDV